MRYLPLLLSAFSAPAPALAAGAGDIPLSAVGLPFAPEAPRPVAASHPLYQRVAVQEMVLPDSVRLSIARKSSIQKGLHDTLQRMNMLAGSEAAAKARLTATWVSIEPSNPFVAKETATATIAYRLVRVDNGQTIFERTIRTSVEQIGSHLDYSMGGRRAAIAANFASAAYCLDKASVGSDPADCALRPLFEVRAERR